MDLHILWFILIGVLFTGFFILEGFDFGVGILLPFLGKNDNERRMIISSIGPFWDGNEVWLITAAGAMFAAFPNWYAAMFSGFYPLMFFMLVALILRGVAFEFRSLLAHARWRRWWDKMIFIGSLLPSVIWGIMIANLIVGMPIDAKMNYVGDFWHLLNPFALLCGAAFALLFTLHGAIFLNVRVNGIVMKRALRAARWLWVPTFALILLVIGYGFLVSDIMRRIILDVKMVPLTNLLLAVLGIVLWQISKGRSGWAFAMTSLTIILAAVITGLGMFPHVMVSSLNPAWSLTVAKAASSTYTLTVMSWLALTLIPFVLLYQAWNYWVFRKRIEPHAIGH
jgi:cytochrome d ubiquinol oxidase subunit II